MTKVSPLAQLPAARLAHRRGPDQGLRPAAGAGQLRAGVVLLGLLLLAGAPVGWLARTAARPIRAAPGAKTGFARTALPSRRSGPGRRAPAENQRSDLVALVPGPAPLPGPAAGAFTVPGSILELNDSLVTQKQK
jgi:hypothetical protein